MEIKPVIIFIYIIVVTNNASAIYTCSVSGNPNINFGNIATNVINTINSTISVTCSGIASLQMSYTIALNAGSAGGIYE